MWTFESFYRKRIARITAPLQAEIAELNAKLSYANEIVKAVRLQNDELLTRVDLLNLEIDRAKPRNGLIQSQYVNVALPYPLVDRDGESLSGVYQGCAVDYELTCAGQGGLTVLRSSLMRYDQLAYLAFEVLGSARIVMGRAAVGHTWHDNMICKHACKHESRAQLFFELRGTAMQPMAYKSCL